MPAGFVVANFPVIGFVVAHVGDTTISHGEDFEEEGDSTNEAHFVGTNHMFGEEADEDGMGDDNDNTVFGHFLEMTSGVTEAMDKGVIRFAVMHRAFFIA